MGIVYNENILCIVLSFLDHFCLFDLRIFIWCHNWLSFIHNKHGCILWCDVIILETIVQLVCLFYLFRSWSMGFYRFFIDHWYYSINHLTSLFHSSHMVLDSCMGAYLFENWRCLLRLVKKHFRAERNWI